MVLMSDRWHCRFSKADACEKKWVGMGDTQQIVPSCHCAGGNERLSMFFCSDLTNNIRVRCADPYGLDFKRSRLVWQMKKWAVDFSFLWLGIHWTGRLEEGYHVDVMCPWRKNLSDVHFYLHDNWDFFLNSTRTNTHAHVCNVKKVFPRSHKSDQASMSLIVPGGHRLCVYFKHSAVFAISAMGVKGGILLRAWILMGFLSEKTGPARITPPLYCDGFSSDWTLVYSKALSYEGDCFSAVSAFLDNGSTKAQAWLVGLLSRSLVSGRESRDIFHVTCHQLGPQYNFSVPVCLVSWAARFAFCTRSAKKNQPYHFTVINTQPLKYYRVKTQVLNMTDIHNPMCIQFHNLWGRHTAGISLFWQMITGFPFLAWFSISYFSPSWCLFNTYP